VSASTRQAARTSSSLDSALRDPWSTSTMPTPSPPAAAAARARWARAAALLSQRRACNWLAAPRRVAQRVLAQAVSGSGATATITSAVRTRQRSAERVVRDNVAWRGSSVVRPRRYSSAQLAHALPKVLRAAAGSAACCRRVWAYAARRVEPRRAYRLRRHGVRWRWRRRLAGRRVGRRAAGQCTARCCCAKRPCRGTSASRCAHRCAGGRAAALVACAALSRRLARRRLCCAALCGVSKRGGELKP
jgi:hypothetical protein